MYSLVKSKKAVSVIIGYVLLVTFAVIIGVIVFQWMKTYVPQEELNCPDGVSLFIEHYNYDCLSNNLTLNLKNNGKFNIGGYFIHATNKSGAGLATVDLTKYNTNLPLKLSTGIKFVNTTPGNLFQPGNKTTEEYNLTGIGNNISSVEIFPIRWQNEKNRIRLVSCKDAKIVETLRCGAGGGGGECVPSCNGKICGDNGCGTGICGAGCSDPTPNCINNGQQCSGQTCTPTCVNKECGDNSCGTGTCGTACALENSASQCNATYMCQILTCNTGYGNCDLNRLNGCETDLTSSLLHCGSCPNVCTDGKTCVGGICITSSTCDGTWTGASETSDVQCDGTPKPANCLANCTCTGGYVSNGAGGCKIPDSVSTCGDYCVWLITPVYSDGTCRQSESQCLGHSEVHEAGGDVLPYCNPANPLQDFCCCKP